MRHLFTLLSLMMLHQAIAQQLPTMFAHRGCWSKNEANEFIIPENSLPAVAMAKRMGYTGIECDVHYTKDGRMVILHDATLNRTMRRAADYSKLDKPVRLDQLTFDELRRDYVLESENPAWRTPVPTLEELLLECKKQGIVPMLHSAIMESYHVAQELFGDEWICFTGGVDHLRKVREFSNCTILLAINSGTAEEHIASLEKIGGNCGISTMKYALYTPQFCKALTSRGYIVQASIFPSPHEAIAQRNGISYQLTDFSIMPTHKPIAKGKIKATAQGENMQWRYAQEVECGAITLEVEYEGEIEVIINGKRRYTLSRTTKGKDIVGNRLFDTKPTVEIIKKGDARVNKATTKVYKY